MAEFSTIRLNVVLRELNISLDRAVEFLAQQNIEIEGRPTSKISKDIYQILLDEFETDKSKKDASHEISEVKRKEKESLRILQEKKEQERLDQLQKRQEIIKAKALITKPVTKGKIDLDATNPKPLPTSLNEVENSKPIPTTTQKSEATTLNKEKNDKVLKSEHGPKVDRENKESTTPIEGDDINSIKTKYKTLSGPKKTGQTIDLDEFKKKQDVVEEARKRKRKRISKESSPKSSSKGSNNQNRQNSNRNRSNSQPEKSEPSDE